MQSQETIALQQHYLKKMEDFFWILFHLGGILPQSQICRLLNNNIADTTTNTALMEKLESIGLIKRVALGNSMLVIAKLAVCRYFGYSQAIRYNPSRLKRGSLILEKFLRLEYYKKPLEELKKSLEKTNCLAYYPTCKQAINLLNKYMVVYEGLKLNTNGIKNELARLEKRYNLQYEEDGNKLDIPNIYDLYTLECLNIFLSSITFIKQPSGKYKMILKIDMFDINNLQPLRLAKNIEKALLTLQSIFGIYNICINIYSHESENKTSMEKVYRYLGKYFTDENALKNFIRFHYYDTRANLFSGIIPENFF